MVTQLDGLEINTMEKTIDVPLSARDIVLLRCGLLRRMNNLKDRPECQESYDQSKVLLQILWDAGKQLEVE